MEGEKRIRPKKNICGSAKQKRKRQNGRNKGYGPLDEYDLSWVKYNFPDLNIINVFNVVPSIYDKVDYSSGEQIIEPIIDYYGFACRQEKNSLKYYEISCNNDGYKYIDETTIEYITNSRGKPFVKMMLSHTPILTTVDTCN